MIEFETGSPLLTAPMHQRLAPSPWTTAYLTLVRQRQQHLRHPSLRMSPSDCPPADLFLGLEALSMHPVLRAASLTHTAQPSRPVTLLSSTLLPQAPTLQVLRSMPLFTPESAFRLLKIRRNSRRSEIATRSSYFDDPRSWSVLLPPSFIVR